MDADTHMSDQRADQTAASPPRGRDWSAWSRGARSAASTTGAAGARLGNWLASVGWWKFFLLLILLLMAASLADDMFFSSSRARRRDYHVPVEVKISVDSDGLHITAPPHAPAPAHAAAPPHARESGAKPRVQIDDKGLRIQTDKDGHKETVVIDSNGLRVERTAPEAEAGSASRSAANGASGEPDEGKPSARVTVPPDVLSDPDKIGEAVDAAHDQIEEIVQQQVDRKMAHLKAGGAGQSSGWPDLADWALMLGFALLIVKIAMGSKRRAETRAQEADAAAAEEGLKRQLAEAQLKTMQAQVEPHFLFNTLASVDYLIETDPARASRMQKNLIQFLRAALPQMRQASSTLGQEMALCRSYLEILKVRMDERLQFAITMPAGLSSAAFPPMMLQTLVENSIKHGLEPKPEGGTLTLSADVVDGNVRVAVSDTGLGFGASGSGGGGVGLNNVRERLKALFGVRGRLSIAPNAPSGTIATIEVPYTVASAEAMPMVSPQPA
jgi:hypothetical protein